MNTELKEFVRQSLGKGVARDDVRRALVAAGWSEPDIQNGLGAFADIESGIPVPRPRSNLDARESFIYAVQFVALYVTVYYLGSIAFYFIDRAFPEALNAGQLVWKQSEVGLRWGIASVIVAFPIFYVAYSTTYREIERDITKRHSRPRRSLTYLTLFLAVLCVAGDLIDLLYSFLSGELTARILLKLATVAILAIGMIGFLMWDVRRDEVEP